MRKLLALDQASRTTGWAVFSDTQLIDYGHFTIAEDDIGIRLQKIREHVQKLIEDYGINEIIFEDIQLQKTVGNNVVTFKILAEVFGVIYELATELQIPNSAVLSTVWRSGLKINDAKQRNIQKQHAQDYVLKTYGKKATQDECDAICIGSYAIGKTAAADYSWE